MAEARPRRRVAMARPVTCSYQDVQLPQAALLRRAASIPPPDAAGAAAPIAGIIAPAPAPAAPAMGPPAREETTAELGEKYLASMRLNASKKGKSIGDNLSSDG